MKIKRNELDVNELVSILNDCSANTPCIVDALESFVSDRNFLGTSYDIVRNVMMEYIQVFEHAKQISEKLSLAIISSTQNMKNFMEEYEELDDDNIDKMQQEIKTLNGYIQSINEKIKATTDDSELQTLRYQISNYFDKRNKLNRLFEKTEKLNSTDLNQYNNISLIDDDLSKLNSEINNISEIAINSE